LVGDGESAQFIKQGVVPGYIECFGEIKGYEVDIGLGGEYGCDPVNQADEGRSGGSSWSKSELV